MRGVVLADAGPLYALRDPDDALHERSHEELGRLRAQRLKVVVPYSTLLESHVLVLRKLGITEAHFFLRHLTGTAILVNPTAEDYDRAIARVLRYPDQDISLADAVVAEISERLDVPVWTYDHHSTSWAPACGAEIANGVTAARPALDRLVLVRIQVWQHLLESLPVVEAEFACTSGCRRVDSRDSTVPVRTTEAAE